MTWELLSASDERIENRQRPKTLDKDERKSRSFETVKEEEGKAELLAAVQHSAHRLAM